MRIKSIHIPLSMLAVCLLASCGPKDWIDDTPTEISCSSEDGGFSLVNKYEKTRKSILIELDNFGLKVYYSQDKSPIIYEVSKIEGLVFERLGQSSHILAVNNGDKTIGVAKLNENCAKMIEMSVPTNMLISRI